MLSFFHGLNAVLWYGERSALRGIVILDPQWVIDAVTCFVRDFELRDHTEGYERMGPIDQLARRKEPAAWDLLAKGRATLQRKLLTVLWSHAEFAPHKEQCAPPAAPLRHPIHSLHGAHPAVARDAGCSS